MEQTKNNQASRRNFLSRVIPLCAVSCLSANTLFAEFPMVASALSAGNAQLTKEINQKTEKHKFQKNWIRTYEESFRWRYGYYIEIMEQFAKYLGREKLIGLIMQAVDDSNIKTEPDNPEHTFRKFISGGKIFKNMMTSEIIEESDRVYEIKVTECLWTKIFKEKNATDIGYATVCYSDYSSPKPYHSKIKFQRTKSLMQGHKYCNHRWTWEDKEEPIGSPLPKK